MGIDGYSFMEQLPIQVKQSDKVGRVTVDNFETAIERYGSTKGYIVAFSFTRNAREEVARVKAEKGLEIELVEVATLVEGPPDKATHNCPIYSRGCPRTSSASPAAPATKTEQAIAGGACQERQSTALQRDRGGDRQRLAHWRG